MNKVSKTLMLVLICTLSACSSTSTGTSGSDTSSEQRSDMTEKIKSELIGTWTEKDGSNKISFFSNGILEIQEDPQDYTYEVGKHKTLIVYSEDKETSATYSNASKNYALEDSRAKYFIGSNRSLVFKGIEYVKDSDEPEELSYISRPNSSKTDNSKKTEEIKKDLIGYWVEKDGLGKISFFPNGEVQIISLLVSETVYGTYAVVDSPKANTIEIRDEDNNVKKYYESTSPTSILNDYYLSGDDLDFDGKSFKKEADVPYDYKTHSWDTEGIDGYVQPDQTSKNSEKSETNTKIEEAKKQLVGSWISDTLQLLGITSAGGIVFEGPGDNYEYTSIFTDGKYSISYSQNNLFMDLTFKAVESGNTGSMKIEKVSSINEAMNDRFKYYCDGKTLVFMGMEFTKMS